MITKSKEHDINRAGKRLFRKIMEQLGWVVNDVQEDYGIDSNVQVFDGKWPSGVWFHVQLKSSGASGYSSDYTFISQELSIDHARHYAVEMRDPVLLIHADVESDILYWYSPQLSQHIAIQVENKKAQSITVRIPTRQQLPATAPEMLLTLNRVYLILASRELTSASTSSFIDSLKHLPDQDALHRAFQEKTDTLKLQKIAQLIRLRQLVDARIRAEVILNDPDSSIDVKFWAEIQLEAIDYKEILHAGKPQSELSRTVVSHAIRLQKLTASGPKYLKFFSLMARKAGELDLLVYEDLSLFMSLRQHLQGDGNPMMALGIYARRAAITKRIISKYNQCLRLVYYAANSPDRWILARALTRIVNAGGAYLITLHSENNFKMEQAMSQSGLSICKLAAWIADETGDDTGVALAIISALVISRSTASEAYRWAEKTARNLRDDGLRVDTLNRIDRAAKRWRGEQVAGDYQGDTILQIMQNMASAFGIDMSNENDPIVRALKIAAKDNSPERVLANCEHLLVSQGATGPVARKIKHLFNITTAGSKIVHCTLHDYHQEGRELDVAYEKFRLAHCESCPDRRPHVEGWKYTDEARRRSESQNFTYVSRLAGTEHGIRYTDKD